MTCFNSRFTQLGAVFSLLLCLVACQAEIDFNIEQKIDDNGNDYATISWNVQPQGDVTPTRVTLEPGFGDVDFTGSVDVFPDETTQYRFTVYAEFPDGGIANTVVKGTVYVGPSINYDLFVDPQFRACVESTGFTHIQQFSALVCQDRGITSILGIEQLTDLQIVTLDLNSIEDLSPLAPLSNVHTLSLTNNELDDLSTLPYMESLTNLVLFNNHIEDITPLAANPQLLNLALNHNDIVDVEQFGFLTNVTNLSIAHNAIEDIAPIGLLTQLQNLDASYNALQRGVWGLRTLTNTSVIDLRGNGDVKCLEYANLIYILGTAVLVNDCTFPPPEETSTGAI
ncbi:MAG: hypothetical protein MI976_13805 [Pseudomonadales bacterium]|nr:hypothetical protein [Pseudomonadales bacterium]